jgi:hypothetical protein
VRAFLRQIELALDGRGERDVDLLEEQLLDDLRPLLGEKVNGFRVRDAGAGAHDVVDQLRGRVVLALIDDAALRPRRVAVRRIDGFRHEQHADAGVREREGRRQTGDAGADHQRGKVFTIRETGHERGL